MRWIGSLVLGLLLVSASQAQDLEFGGRKTSEWLKLLKEGKEVKLRRGSLIALEVIGARKGVVDGVIAAAASDSDEAVRREATLVLGRMGVDAKSAIPVLGEMLAKDKADKVREAAAMALGGRLSELAKSQVLVLGRALKDSYGPTRTAAAETLKNFRQDALEATPHLVELVRDAKSEDIARRYAIVALSRLSGLNGNQQDDVVAALTLVAKDESATLGVRESALEGLGHLKLEKSIAGLVVGLESKEPDLRRTASRGLVQLKEKAKDAWTAVEKAAADSDAGVRSQVILVCGNIGKGKTAAVKVLIQAAEKDGNLENRLSAIRALGDLGAAASDAVPLLKNLSTSDVRASIRDAASQAAKKIGGA